MPPRVLKVRPVARVPPSEQPPNLESSDDDNDDDDEEEALERRPVRPQPAPNLIRPIGSADDGALWPLMDTPSRAVQTVQTNL